ncbi:hypothetical protein [Stenotrophomonas indicatrix]|uniref:hypothetical protein n=1 Tax=Stenotrophomonas indicatrix TaxID=2045451 RepID=UPI0008C95B9D|nr:hypothetical protein [Stenotrophomonas indicatrix]SEU13132.1 hypothetical protein SAMN05720615_11860 [Stenotrophomonas indicatrix]
MADIPNLAGVATAELVEKIGGGSFQASYINWSRTLNLLREHAPGWLPESVPNHNGAILHEAPVGAYLLIRFRHVDGTVTPEVPQAVMDSRNAAIPLQKITARDITDTHRRGVCLAAALTFGLAYELWAKVALESGYQAESERAEPEPEPEPERESPSIPSKASPLDGVWDSLSEEEKEFIRAQADKVKQAFADGGAEAAASMIYRDLNLTNDEVMALWTQLPSNIRNQSKKFKDQFSTKEAA